jgi:hypothetical protein
VQSWSSVGAGGCGPDGTQTWLVCVCVCVWATQGDGDDNVKVAVRMRPFNSREVERGSTLCIKMPPGTQQTIITDPTTGVGAGVGLPGEGGV